MKNDKVKFFDNNIIRKSSLSEKNIFTTKSIIEVTVRE